MVEKLLTEIISHFPNMMYKLSIIYPSYCDEINGKCDFHILRTNTRNIFIFLSYEDNAQSRI